MNNDFEQPQQFPQGQPQWEQQSQYGQPQQFPQGQPQWEQQSQYGQPQWGQQQQYGPVPSYAQAQPGDNSTTNWLMGWLAYRAIIRIVVPIVIILLMLGACVFFGLLSAVFH